MRASGHHQHLTGELRFLRPAGVVPGRQSSLLSRLFSDVLSIEASFVLCLFAGRYKNLPELQDFPIDFTLFFFVTTIGSTAWGLMSGRVKPPPLNACVLLMAGFICWASVSLFWSSGRQPNEIKLMLFLLLTSPCFFVASMLGQDRVRRKRFVRLTAALSCAIVLYYMYYRYLLGIDLTIRTLDDQVHANSYQEYGAHAAILFITLLCFAVFGTGKKIGFAVPGAAVALIALAMIGARGALMIALMAVIPITALGVLLNFRSAWRHFRNLAVFISLLVAAVVAGFLAFMPVEGEDAAWEQFHTLERIESQVSGEDTVSVDQRLLGRHQAFEAWLQKPVFGWGIGEFQIQHEWLVYPHNLFLEVLMEMGLVGAYLLFGVCAIAIWRSVGLVRDGDSDWVDWTLGLLFVTELIAHLTWAGYLADERIFLSYLGLVIALRRNAKHRFSSLNQAATSAR